MPTPSEPEIPCINSWLKEVFIPFSNAFDVIAIYDENLLLIIFFPHFNLSKR